MQELAQNGTSWIAGYCCAMSYDLWYWPGVPGRGEFVRLALEAGQIAYRDRAMESEDGADLLLGDMGRNRPHPPFAPPYLVAGDMVIAQTANILLFLGDRHGLAPRDLDGRLWVNQIQLTIADIVVEAHDVHHPIAGGLYYEDQKVESARRAADFRANRIPKYLHYFDRALAGTEWIGGNRWSYADLSLFHLIGGLEYAFPRRMATVMPECSELSRLREAVMAIEPLAGYLSSDRRQAFGNGIFRYYPELDGD
jgi:glutathione S-transferase